jgi:hypothetical protein
MPTVFEAVNTRPGRLVGADRGEGLLEGLDAA